MTDQVRVSDFEWASAARYIVEVSVQMGLTEFNWDAVYSFPYSSLGPDKLKARKVRLLAAIIGDLEKVETYVKENTEGLDRNSMAVLRSMYIQYREAKSLLEDHIDRIRKFNLLLNAELRYFDVGIEGGGDDIPF